MSLLKSLYLQLINAISALHNEALFAHMDIKLENILITNDGEVKIIDFGTMEKLDIDAKDKIVLQMLDHVYGTLEYTAPELLRNYFNKSSDIWSLGIIIYEL